MMKDMNYSTIIQCRERSGYFFSLSLGLTALCRWATAVLPPSPSLSLSLPLCPSYVLAWQCNCGVFLRFSGRYLWDPSVWERTDAWVHIYLSLISIMHTPAIPPAVSPSLSLSLSLHFCFALPHFVSRTKEHFSVCHQDDDRQEIEAFVVLIPLKSFS